MSTAANSGDGTATLSNTPFGALGCATLGDSSVPPHSGLLVRKEAAADHGTLVTSTGWLVGGLGTNWPAASGHLANQVGGRDLCRGRYGVGFVSVIDQSKRTKSMWEAKNLLILLVLVSSPNVARCESLGPDDWPQFRGTNASGVATGDAPPTSWDISTSQNIAWKTEVPGLGFASPIICRNQVVIVTAVGAEKDPRLRTGLYGAIKSVDDEGPHSWEVCSLSLRTGKVLWKRILHAGPPTMKRHTKSSHANATPATDGKHVIVNLASEGLYCLDLRGNLRWKTDLGPLDSGYYVAPDAQWGYASSPIIFQGMAIVLADVQEDSFLAAFDVRSGRELWRTNRQDVPTWGTPTIVQEPHCTELVVNGHRHSSGYEPQTGRELWTLSGGGDIPVPTPVTGHGFVYLSSSHGGKRPLRAIRPGARGDISLKKDDAVSENIVWTQPKDGIYIQTPLVYGPHLYACRTNGVLSCYD